MARRRSSQDAERLAAQLLAQTLSTRQGRRAIFVLLIIGLVAWGAWFVWQKTHGPQHATAHVTTPSERIRIATWNLRKFADRDKPGQHPPDLVTIAKIIRENEFDLLVIQEVQQQGQIVQKLRRQLNEPWRVEITEPTGNHERYAFLYRADKVELLEGPRLAAEAGALDRLPAVATFRSGQFDFTLVTAHLWYGEKANNPQRQAEAGALARFARQLADGGKEKDIIVLGDFNEMRAGPNLGLFEAQGWFKLNDQPTNLGSNEVFDNLLINRGYTREYAGVSGAVRFDETLFANDDERAREDVSDHRPAWADFVTTGPDDD